MPTRTILVNGNGTGTLSFQLDGPDVTEVEAVLAEIDASGAGDTTATLTATSPAGSDVAAVPQGQAISGGGQGRATWALRLAEEAPAVPVVPPLITTDGVHTVNPTHELLIDGNMSLANLGAGIARLSAVVPPASPPVQWQAIRTDALRAAGGFFSPDWGVPADTQQSAALVQAAYLGPGFPAGSGLATFVVLAAGTYLFYYYCSCSTLTQDALTIWEANFSTPPYHMFPLAFGNWEALVNVGIHVAQWPQPGFGFDAGAAMLGFFSAVPSAFQSMTIRFAPQAGEDPTGATEAVFVAVKIR